jgi:hypothetical protein
MRLASLLERGIARTGKPRDTQKPPAGQSFPVPAPSLGMNTRDSVATLDPREARILENMIPESGKVVIRKGKTEHEEISGATSVGSMWTHQGVTADVMLAAADGEIWNVTGDPDDLTAANYSLNTWSMAQFDDTTIAVNGTDTPWAFNGTAVGASGLSGSGLTIANLRTVHIVGIRMWFTEEGSADVWYGAVNAVTGVLTKFQLSQETKGGYCVGVYGFGPNTIFVMSTGEIVAYQGDPATTFSQVKTYASPKPVGYDPGIDAGGSLIIMTASGPLPFEAIAAGVGFDSTALQSWGKIAPSWAADFDNYGDNPGWNALFYKGLVIFNIPLDATTAKQWIFNTRTKAWSFFSNIPANQFAELGGTLYFSSKTEGKVFANTGGTDDGTSIDALIRHAFGSPFGNRVNGQYTLASATVKATGSVTGQLQVDVNYEEAGIGAPEVPISSSGSGPWDGPWDEPWGEDGQARKRWSGISGFGRAVAPVVAFHSSADVLEYFGTDIIGAPAGPIG